jgi:Predicted oxidoreductases (related to aryl-alcohol dehydrogenases)
MEYRRLGRTDWMVSVVSFGAWQIGDAEFWGHDDAANAETAVRVALDEGITLFDTAEMYGAGASEEALGKALGARRKDVYIADKVSPENCAPDRVRSSCEASLRRLGTDFIDLYQVHWPSRTVPL